MNKFVNPHQYFNTLNQPNQQHMMQQHMMQQHMMNQGMMQQPMMPMQGMAPMQGMMQQPMMPMQGMMQQNMMPMQGMMPAQGMFQQDRRFITNGLQNNPSVNVRISSQEQSSDSRYNQQENKNTVFEVSNSLLKGATMHEKEILDLDENIASDCLEESVEAILELFYNNKNKLINGCINKAYIHKTFFETSDIKEKLNSLFKLNDLDFSKSLYSLYSEQKSREHLVAVKAIDEYYTDIINDWCYLETNSKPSIDSFAADYGDLVSYLSDSNEYAKLKEFVSNEISTTDKLNNIFEDSDDYHFNIRLTMFCCNYISTELNLDQVTSEFSYLTKTRNNSLFHSLSNIAFKHELDKLLYFITLDRKVYKLYRTNKNELFIAKV